MTETDVTHRIVPLLDLTPELETHREEFRDAVERVMQSGHFILGPEVEAFDEEVAAYLGVEHAVGVNSGTDALVIALRGMGVGPGDEVITTPFTFFATAESIGIIGADPVFADIEFESFNVAPEAVEAAATDATKTILPVHLFGRRDEIKEGMAREGVSTKVYYPHPCHELPVYGDRDERYPHAERAAREVLSLPVYPHISEEDQEYIASRLVALV